MVLIIVLRTGVSFENLPFQKVQSVLKVFVGLTD